MFYHRVIYFALIFTYQLFMVYSFENKKEMLKNSVVSGYALAQCNNRKLAHLTIVPGGEIKPHVVPLHATFYVVSGNGMVTINDQKTQAGTGDVIDVQAGANRGWLNNGTEPLVLIAIKNIA